jgi:hypothetical protein
MSAPLFIPPGAPGFSGPPGPGRVKLNSAGAPVVVPPSVTATRLDPATLKPLEPAGAVQPAPGADSPSGRGQPRPGRAGPGTED